jgi:hypothetical protein
MGVWERFSRRGPLTARMSRSIQKRSRDECRYSSEHCASGLDLKRRGEKGSCGFAERDCGGEVCGYERRV